MMRIALLILFFAAVLISSLVAFLPMQVVAERARANTSNTDYSHASGTLWNGKIHNVLLGDQDLGDVTLTADPMLLFQGKLGGDFLLTGGGLEAGGSMIAKSERDYEASNVRVSGQTGQLVGLADQVRELDGRFQIRLNEVRVSDNLCDKASGTIWSDLLVRMDARWQWRGPELEGPITCENGQFLIQMRGRSETGEDISVRIDGGLDGKGRFETRIASPTDDLRRVSLALGFTPSNGDLVYVRTFPE